MTPPSKFAATLSLCALGLGAVSLSACGRVGMLDQPAPLYGQKAKADYQTKKAAAAAAAAKAGQHKDNGEAEPLAPDTPGPDAPPAAVPNLRESPPPGSRPLPGAPEAPGVLPDPYNHPP